MKSSIRLFVAVLFFAFLGSLNSLAQSSGGFWGPGIAENLHAWSDDITETILGVNSNEVRVRQFILQSSFTIGHVTTELLNPVNGATFNFGVYDSSGNLLLDSGAFNGSYAELGVIQTASITSVTLNPGTYYYAQSASSSGISTVGLAGNSNLIEVDAIANAVTTRFAVAANMASGGALPSTLGTLTPEGSNPTGTGLALFEP